MVLPQTDRIPILISIDPGITTGVAIRTASGEITTRTYKLQSELISLFGSMWVTDNLYKHVVVIEDFIGSGNLTKEGKYTIKLIGAVEALCTAYGFELYIQPPQRRKAFQDEAHSILFKKLQRFVIHEEDALAHLLRWEYDNVHRRYHGVTDASSQHLADNNDTTRTDHEQDGLERSGSEEATRGG